MTFYRTPFEEWVMQWGSLVGLVIAALALIFAAWRFVWIKKVLTQGTAINGTVEDVDIYSREADTSSTTPIFQRPGIYTYYALIRYPWQGIDRKVRLNLPLSPSTYQLFKGRAAELLVLDSTAGKPLLRTVYLDPIGLRRQSLPVGRRS